MEKSRANMLSLLQLLKVVVRARGRLRKVKDIVILDKILQREADFMGLGKGTQHNGYGRTAHEMGHGVQGKNCLG
ncbi:MAG: hypothetical protein JRF45_11750 [Deltaproteobacteria bacterium]|nr:hypothetical protein [Deltaproteobacteria bacterium]MBW1970085.1 hypothetical protein [Deltaproteobacteria bacterium]MBW2156481.1 hypothetical protein [Deltaproteobacteria bacterium]MBW2197473.1 hypothetical protein [Deltaproteobacteria bacterium]MBW2327129.1 hypothetical protein [Deltaproteobacteria bacterium]